MLETEKAPVDHLFWQRLQPVLEALVLNLCCKFATFHLRSFTTLQEGTMLVQDQKLVHVWRAMASVVLRMEEELKC